MVFVKSRGKTGKGREVFWRKGWPRSGINMGCLEKSCCESDVVMLIVLGGRSC